MHAVCSAIPLIEPRGSLPGVCQSSASSGSRQGFFVPYRCGEQVGGILEQSQAEIELFVRDPHSHFIDLIPFVIDTATDVTIIPRTQVGDAFQSRNAVPPYLVPVVGLTGRTVFGRAYSASLSIAPPSSDFESLSFGSLTVVVVDETSWGYNYGMLGLDALRRVVMVSDADHVSFWSM